MTDVAPAPPKVNSGSMRRLTADSRFRRLWVAQFVSSIGDWLIIGLLIPMVTALSGGSSFAVAGVLIAKIVPSLVLSSVTGPLVDRFDRRKVMIIADVVRLVLVLNLMWINSLPAIYAVVLLMETASLFFLPSRNSLIPALVGDEDVTSANGLVYTTQQVATIVGLTASGAMLAGFEAVVRAVMSSDLPWVSVLAGPFAPALLGSRAGFFLDALTFVFSASIVATIRVDARPAARPGALSLKMLGRDVVESFRFLAEHKELRGLLVTVFLAILGGGAIVPVGVNYVNSLVGGLPFENRVQWLRTLSGTPQTFMLVFMAVGMGVGAMIVPRLEHRLPLQVLFAGSVTGFAFAMAGFAMVTKYASACVYVAIAGVCIAAVTVAGNSYVVRTTSDDLRGRVFTTQESVIRVAMLLSMSVMAPLSDAIGGVIRHYVALDRMAPRHLVLTDSRLTLLVSAVIVFIAAGYSLTHVRWSAARTVAEVEQARMQEEDMKDE